MTDQINLESLKGIYDRYPEEWTTWKKLIEVVDETAEEFGFRQIDPPSIERQELWTSKDEEEIVDQMYAFTDKGDHDVTLIPEQTPTRARLIQKRKDLKTPVKWYCTSKRWRYEDVTKGRDREFRQGDFDIFGVESVEADAEIIAAAATIYKKLSKVAGVDLTERVSFRINDRKLLEAILDNQGISETERVMKVIDDMEKMSKEEFIEKASEILAEDEEVLTADATVLATTLYNFLTNLSMEIDEAVKNMRKNEGVPQEKVDRMEKLSDQLEAYGVKEMCVFDPTIVRGLAYYTGLVFEAFDSEGELRALFGGGRYDNLVGEFGGQEMPAVGFGFGYSPTVELLKREGRYPLKDIETDIYVLTVSGSVKEKGLEYATKLRDYGLDVETDLSGRGFGSQLDYADSINAKRVLIVGERDLEQGQVTMKHMDSGEEEELDQDEVVEHLKSEGF